MPSRVFLRESMLTTEQWQSLIYKHVALIVPLLNQVTLPKLGDLNCLFDTKQGWCISLRSAQKYIEEPTRQELEEILDLQGIFLTAYNRNRTFPLEKFLKEFCANPQYICGIDRRGRWTLAELKVERIFRDHPLDICGSHVVCRSLTLHQKPEPEDILAKVQDPLDILRGLESGISMVLRNIQERQTKVGKIATVLRDDIEAATAIGS